MTPPPIQRAEEAIRPLTREDWDKPGEAPVFEQLRKINQVFPELLAYAKEREGIICKITEDCMDRNEKISGLEAKVQQLEKNNRHVCNLNDAVHEMLREEKTKVQELEKERFLYEKMSEEEVAHEIKQAEEWLNNSDHRVEPADIEILTGHLHISQLLKLGREVISERDALQKRIDGAIKGETLDVEGCYLGVHATSWLKLPAPEDPNFKALYDQWRKEDEEETSKLERIGEDRKVLILPLEENIKAIALNPEATITIKVLPAEETV